MNKFMPTGDQPAITSQSTISPLELARFLAQLANLYASPDYGNPQLSLALRELASAIRRKEPASTRGNRSKDEALREISPERLDELRALGPESIVAFLADESKTKTELLGLASARFSMPVSQLKRMRIDEVRQAINAALLHESSIAILSAEAGRDGANRSS